MLNQPNSAVATLSIKSATLTEPLFATEDSLITVRVTNTKIFLEFRNGDIAAGNISKPSQASLADFLLTLRSHEWHENDLPIALSLITFYLFNGPTS